MNVTDKDVIDFFITSKNKINTNYIRNIDKYPEYKNYLLTRYDDEKCLRNIIWRIYFKQEHRNVCPICGNITPFDKNNFNKTGTLYRKYCCSSCAAKSKERNDKYKHTCLLKYGVENPLNIEDVRQLSITNAQSKESVYKRNKTYAERYNGRGLGSDIIANKIRTTIKDKYGVNYPAQSTYIKDKIKETNNVKYGSDWIVTSSEFKEKSKNTCIEKYGVDNYRKSNINIAKSHSKEAINKCICTKRKNKSLNVSKIENEIYKLLIEKFEEYDVIAQYKSKEYPFCCDFYIKSLDLYIECNFHWTHGFHPYNENNIEDVKKLDLWKSKGTNYYFNAINTWTIRDVNKRNTAKKNNLNYIELFSLDEAKKFIDNNIYNYDSRRINT